MPTATGRGRLPSSPAGTRPPSAAHSVFARGDDPARHDQVGSTPPDPLGYPPRSVRPPLTFLIPERPTLVSGSLCCLIYRVHPLPESEGAAGCERPQPHVENV